MKQSLKLALLTASFLVLSSTAFAAYSGDISISNENISFSNNNFLEGRATRIYAQASNLSNQDLLGTVRFFDNDKQISGDQPVSILAGKTDSVFIDWVPGYGTHKIAAKIFPWEQNIDNPANNWIVTEIFAGQDTDRDGTPNNNDDDDDGDGVKDSEDIYPLDANEQYDTDGDGTGNSKDQDDDNDGVPDKFDEMPLDSNETIDTDKDGIGNIADTDDDNDEILDTDEENNGTQSLNPDSDGDGVNDKEDAFPIDPTEQHDTDKDNIGNNKDIDDDNDGTFDEKDKYPLNKGPVIKLTSEKSNIGYLEEHTFDASPSFDEDGNVVSYLWKIDNQEIEGTAVKHTFDSLGEHSVKLTIIDDAGESRSADFQVNVTNIDFYLQIGLTLLILLLAIVLYIKYIAGAKNSKV